MANANKAKGDRAERAVREWYGANGFPDAVRTRAGYARDWGDVLLLPQWHRGPMAQVKDCQVLRWSTWLDRLDRQQSDSGALAAWLVVKRPGMGNPAGWLAVMTVAKHRELLSMAGFE